MGAITSARRPWTPDEEARLAALLPTHTREAIAVMLGRSVFAVKQRAERLRRGQPAPDPCALTPAQAKLVAAHAGWAERGARKHAARWRRWVTEDDLCSAAYLGLVLAARKFDPSRGLSFKTLAFTYCEASMRREVMTRRRLDGCVFDQAVEGGMRVVAQRIEWPTFENGQPMDLAAVPAVQDVDLERASRLAAIRAALTCPRDQALLDLIGRHDTLRAAAREAGMPHRTLHLRVTKIIERVRGRLHGRAA
jgi:RNA polymerase sigma factor (sigma-70 family)